MTHFNKLSPAQAERLAIQAYFGSLDAAKALHEVLLSGWVWSIINNLSSGIWIAHVTKYDASTDEAQDFGGVSNVPARAWLLAILDALIQKEEDNAGQ